MSDRHDNLMRSVGLEPWTEEEKSGLWQCDGCHIIGIFDVVDEHLETVNRLRDGSLKEPEDVTCWGMMSVGSPSWEAYWGEGVHPMSTLLGQVAKIVKDLD